MAFTISSPAFESAGPIPRVHTCEGEDRPPPLEWTGAPDGTASFALIVDDPDAPDPAAPKRTFVHWVIVDLPPDADAITGAAGGLPAGAREGPNDAGGTGWSGPCPPIGRHRYFFKLYALDTTLPSLRSPTKAELERAMEGHVLAQAELMGMYEKGD
jgi:Raf kinase inhibitor-like YbhB/YbcL family protein